MLSLGANLAACGKCGDKGGGEAEEEAAAEVTQASPIEGASTIVDLKLPTEPEPGEPDADGKEEVLNALLALEIPEMSKSRASRNGDTVTLQFDHIKANDSGSIGTIEVTAGFCAGCQPTDAGVAEEDRMKRTKEELGEVHAENPDMVIEFGELELAPERMGSKVYRKSFAIKEEARAAVHTLSVEFYEANRMIRLMAYPRTGFPSDAAAFEAQYTRAELEADIKAVFAGAMPVVWPPTKL